MEELNASHKSIRALGYRAIYAFDYHIFALYAALILSLGEFIASRKITLCRAHEKCRDGYDADI